jgi:microcompartment protein CcmL/EutN
MTQKALGLIEVIGLLAALEAADTCLKSANTQLIGYEKVTSGLITVKIQGDVGSVKAAIEAAKVSAAKIGKIVSTLVIPRPAEGIQGIISSSETVLSEEGENKEIIILNESNNVKTDMECTAKADDAIEYAGDSEEILFQEKDTPNPQAEVEETAFVSTSEDIPSEDQESKEPEKKQHEQQKDEAFSSQGYTCNLCHDPDCPREKGQPRKQCIHNKENQ